MHIMSMAHYSTNSRYLMSMVHYSANSRYIMSMVHYLTNSRYLMSMVYYSINSRYIMSMVHYSTNSRYKMSMVHYSTKEWLEENSKFFLPPVCNKMMHNDQLKASISKLTIIYLYFYRIDNLTFCFLIVKKGCKRNFK